MKWLPREVFVITTKQKRFAKALLEDYDVPLAEDHLYALEDGPKTEVLKGLVARPVIAGGTAYGPI